MKPKFVLWKEYGFRHIEREDGKKALCGNPSYSDLDKTREWQRELAAIYGGREAVIDDPVRTMKRPLCGTCRKRWKAKTGEELE